MFKNLLLTAFLIIFTVGAAIAGGNELAYFRLQELKTLAAGSVAANDIIPIFDDSAGKVRSIDATNLPFDGNFDGVIGGTTPAAGSFTTLDASGATTLTTAALTGNLSLDDGVTASPSITLQDATNETAVLLKLDSGFATFTTVAADGLNILVGNLKVGNAACGVTQDGEDFCVEGTSEFDGAAQFDGAVTFGSTWTFASTAVASAPIINPGRDSFTICGEATTINNNTVFYGPDVGTLLPNAGNGQTCDINAVGNTTEATADAPAYTGLAFQALGMTCRNESDANADISFTLRTAAGATVPSVTCTISDGDRDCVADVQTTTAIASAATVAVAAASTGDIADANGFVCTVSVAY